MVSALVCSGTVTNRDVDGDGSTPAVVEDVDGCTSTPVDDVNEQSMVSVGLGAGDVEHESELYIKTFVFQTVL